MSRWLTTVAELSGVSLVTWGVAGFSHAAALIVSGAYLVTIAVRNA